jgi:hypothetical protein
MTSLAGEFQTDLPMPDALAACAEAVHGLGWKIESVEARRIVSYADSGADAPPKIEITLDDSGAETDVRIIGSDTEGSRLEKDELVAELNRVRDAIEASIDEATYALGEEPDELEEPELSEEAPDEAEEPKREPAKTSSANGQREESSAGEAAVAPAGWYADPEGPDERWWDGERWTERHRSVEQDSGEQEPEPEEAPDEAEEPKREPAKTSSANGQREESSAGEAAVAPAGWYADPEGPDERWWDGERWTGRHRSVEQDSGEQEPEPEERAREGVGRTTSKDLLWGLSLAFGAVGGTAAAFGVPVISFYIPLGFGIAGAALAIAALTTPGKSPWWAIVAVVASIGGIVVGVDGYSQYNDIQNKLDQAQQQLQQLNPP